jgi:hypothetical protein
MLGGMLSEIRRDLAYLMPGLAIALASFTVLLTGLFTSVGLVVVWVGVPLLAGVLAAARGFAELERRRARAVTGVELPPVHYRQVEGGAVARLLGALKDPQSWRDLAHGIAVLPLSLVTWTVSLMWTMLAVLGPLYPIYGFVTPQYEHNVGLGDLLGWPDTRPRPP